MPEKTLIISGGSSGIGQATALLFAQHAYLVFELSRHGESSSGVVHIDCDVTDELQIKAAVAHVVAETGRVDVLICNAGMGISGPVEFTEMEAAKHLMNVNFFGAYALTKAVLPVMRKQQEGKIILVSSVAAVFSIPYQAFYSASKAAINALALALRNEVKDFGVEVCCLMPGDVKTGFTAAREKERKGNDVYGHAQLSVSAMEKDEEKGMPPEKVALQLLQLAQQRRVSVYHVAGISYRFLCLLDRLLPKTLVNWVVGKLY